jgi:hypothetical protein
MVGPRDGGKVKRSELELSGSGDKVRREFPLDIGPARIGERLFETTVPPSVQKAQTRF